MTRFSRAELLFILCKAIDSDKLRLIAMNINIGRTKEKTLIIKAPMPLVVRGDCWEEQAH